METVGLTAGLLNIVGLFNNAIDCFEYIQLARNFGITFQLSLLKLDVERLRLSRWGKAMGISGDTSDLQLLRQTSISEHEIKEAEDLLGLVLKLMEDAKGVSDKFVRDTGPNDETLLVCDARAELEPTAFSLHNKMSSLCLRRQGRTGLRRKIKWALYEEKHFRKLIDDITHLTDKLVTLFPSIHPSQQHLCDAEVKELGTEDKALEFLRDAAAEQDKDLESAIARALQNSVSLVIDSMLAV